MIKLQMAKWLSSAIFEMKNPRLSGKMISATKAELSSDKRYANVYISVLGSDEKKSGVFEALEHAAGSLGLKFRKNLRLRSAPVIPPEGRQRYRIEQQETQDIGGDP